MINLLHASSRASLVTEGVFDRLRSMSKWLLCSTDFLWPGLGCNRWHLWVLTRILDASNRSWESNFPPVRYWSSLPQHRPPPVEYPTFNFLSLRGNGPLPSTSWIHGWNFPPSIRGKCEFGAIHRDRFGACSQIAYSRRRTSIWITEISTTTRGNWRPLSDFACNQCHRNRRRRCIWTSKTSCWRTRQRRSAATKVPTIHPPT